MTPKLWLLVFFGVPVATYLLTALRLVVRNSWRQWRSRKHQASSS